MKIKKAYFLKSCTKPDQFPDFIHPEFAFIGRSNVGKSSLINMLLNSKNLVKTGSRPGVTQTINFFIVDDNTSIVDLPGFGYAKVPMELKKSFLPMIKNFIKVRKYLKLVFLLIDIRRDPGDFEHQFIQYCTEHNIPVVITLTKCDKFSKSQKITRAAAIRKALDVDADALFYTSVVNKEGKKELQDLIQEFRTHS